ncbi:PfkB family carbohydrate kinase [Anaerococcus nagyae]|uniref:Nucleoside hydrolase n=1 Tax=Anaerococcus nagyae TaxID=1755241 RepID=A0A3E2TG09_9FIRM|nr:PfkB family carbohydrate kinase [Anaerococcus nagyae]RGB74928.1 nucleoside hydrolase [Anaerococcus nagyae]
MKEPVKILNFGSLNIDKIYNLDHIVNEGETVATISYKESLGGKGLNQTIALKRAGVDVYHAGFVGEVDGEILLDYLRDNKIRSLVKKTSGNSGHAIIQVDKNANNSIIDDAFAISFLHNSKVFDVKMVSSVAGNVGLEHTTRNLRGLVKAMDWDVPVYKGLSKPLIGEQILAEKFHGVNGLLGYEFKDDQLAPLEKESAIEAMIKVLEENEKTLIITVGPLTNIASLLTIREDLKEKISEINIMGGAIGMGNVTATSEFNIFADPEAADIVFSSGVKINMLGLNVTTQTSYDINMHKEFKKSELRINQILADIMNRRIKRAGAEENYTTHMHDTLSVMYATNPEIFESKMLHIDIETNGKYTRGMTIADTRLNSLCEKNINVVTSIDKDKFKKIFMENLL